MSRLNIQERPRFLTDENFNMAVTEGLRRHYPEMDIMTVQEVGLTHASDPDVLAATQRLGRILLSHDVNTMPEYFYEALSRLLTGEHLPGALLIAQETPIGLAIEWIAEVWGASDHREWQDLIQHLSA